MSKEISVLFVCLGNICRSPMAEGVFRHVLDEEGLSDRFRVDSAGVHEVRSRQTTEVIEIVDVVSVVGVYLAVVDPSLRSTLTRRHAELVDREQAEGFDPAAVDRDSAETLINSILTVSMLASLS